MSSWKVWSIVFFQASSMASFGYFAPQTADAISDAFYAISPNSSFLRFIRFENAREV